ncbi:MAG: hypothetical protein V1819_03350 [bacterium]
MIAKLQEKEEAIKLRKQGLSYGEILKEVPVTKASLSLWLRDIGLTKEQKQRFVEKRLAFALKGSLKRKQTRIESTKAIKDLAIKEIGELTEREMWLISVALYWAEGAKEKEIDGRIKSGRVRLSNSDPLLVKLFLGWLLNFCGVSKSEIIFRIYLHESSRHRLMEVQKYWSKMLGLPIEYFQKISWKMAKVSTKRKNIGENYFGLVDLTVKRSTNLNRKVAGWVSGICKNL